MNSQVDQILKVSDIEFRWHVHRQPQWCGADGWKGVCLWVELAREPQRALLIEYPFERRARRSTPHRQRPALTRDQVESAIREAMVAGWAPGSRGKAYVHFVAAPAQ